jgi:hypothetical protein
MQTDNRRGTFEDVIRSSTEPMAAIARHLRQLIAGVYPEVTEIPRPAEQHTEYSVGSNRQTEVFGYICPLKDYVRLGFYYGGALPDPDDVLEGEGKRIRHIKIYTLAEAKRPAVRRLLKAAVAERKQALA